MERAIQKRPRRQLPKLCGADIELGNFVLGAPGVGGTGREASRALLREIAAPYLDDDSAQHGTRAGGRVCPATSDPQDWGRKFLGNGGCVYVDLDHVELCLPELISAYDHVAAWHAMLRIARSALDAANARLPGGQRICTLVNNSDGKGNAYGSHLDFLITRAAFDDIFDRKLHFLLFLAAYQVSSVVFTGQGKVGSENGRPPVAFQLSQRADFFETLTGVQTTHRRPIVNSRDEALCGTTETGMARLHCISFDNTLCHASSLLKVGVMQIILAMLEAGRVDVRLILDDPVAAFVHWSHDPTLRARAPTVSGQEVTAVEMQLLFLEAAQRFVAGGGCDGVVPRADDILALWEDTLLKLKSGTIGSLTSRLDWVLKLQVLLRALQRRPDLIFASPEIKHLDHLYSSLDANQGLYWVHERLGLVERFVDDDHIERFVHQPPEDTRAWTRARLLRLAGNAVQDVGWDRVTVRQLIPGCWPVLRTVQLADPLGFTRTLVEPLFEPGAALGEVIDALETSQSTIDPIPTLYDWGKNRALPANGRETNRSKEDLTP
jgi:hypothetical protein